MKTVLITGVAGFIGSHLTEKLLANNYNVIGVDNFNDYYDVKLKQDRVHYFEKLDNFQLFILDITNSEKILSIFQDYRPEIVINLAAQAGVRYSIENPDVYIESNIQGFYNILEACKKYPVKHLIYASSSSVYGNNQKVPFEETDSVDYPVSLYAATKKSNELMANTYSHLYNIPISGLRFFTVYGPMGRPDMAYFGFLDKFFKQEPIEIFNNGDLKNDLYRDFTYVEDIVEGITRLIDLPPEENDHNSRHEIYNIGNNNPIKLMDFIITLEKCLSKSLGRKIEFEKRYVKIKAGDVPATYASTKKLENIAKFKPKTSIDVGLQKFTDWYVKYYDKQ